MQGDAAKGVTTTPVRSDIASAERPPRSAYRIDASETPQSWFQKAVGLIWATPPARQHDHRGDDQHHHLGNERHHHHNGEAPASTDEDLPTNHLTALSLEGTPSPDAVQPCEEPRQPAATENTAGQQPRANDLPSPKRVFFSRVRGLGGSSRGTACEKRTV